MSVSKHTLDACDEANAAFKDGSVLDADRRTLERWMVALAEVRPSVEDAERWNSRRAEAIKLLLQVRITERLHWWSWVVSVLALVVTALALVVAWRAGASSPTPPRPARALSP